MWEWAFNPLFKTNYFTPPNPGTSFKDCTMSNISSSPYSWELQLRILDFQLRIRNNPRTFLWKELPTIKYSYINVSFTLWKKTIAKLPDLTVLGWSDEPDFWSSLSFFSFSSLSSVFLGSSFWSDFSSLLAPPGLWIDIDTD